MQKVSGFTFAGEDGVMLAEDPSASRMHSIEHIREYLEIQLGEDLLMQVYPLLLELGDEVFRDPETHLVEHLGHLMPEEKIKQYGSFFATLIFFEKQSGEEPETRELGEMSANVTLKNLSEMTAQFQPK